MNEVVVKIVLKKESKVSRCKEMIDLISKSENVKSIVVEIVKSKNECIKSLA